MGWTPLGIDGVFFLSLATILAGSFGLAVRYCLRSKCEHFDICCGLLKIDRRVDLEVQEHIRELELGIQTDEEKSLKSKSTSQYENEEKNNV